MLLFVFLLSWRILTVVLCFVAIPDLSVFWILSPFYALFVVIVFVVVLYAYVVPDLIIECILVVVTRTEAEENDRK
jgi:hypothetical protein